MARIKGPRKIQQYSVEFKLKAVKLSDLAGVEVQDVAQALDIHPFMMSRWRKEAREGRLRTRLPWCHQYASVERSSRWPPSDASTVYCGRSTSS